MPSSRFPGLPFGYIPRVELRAGQRAFLHPDTGIRQVMVDIHHAETLVKRGETASTFFPHGSVITTSTIPDSRLCDYTAERELEVVTSFKPAIHIPSDRPVYESQNSVQRRYFIDALQAGTIRIRDGLRGTGITLIPLVKGLTEEEWLLCYEPLASEGFPGFAYYTAQYFGRDRGCRTREVVRDVTGILTACDIDHLTLIGLQSPSVISELPPSVRAFAGQKWRAASGLGRLDVATARQIYREWARAMLEATHHRQDILHEIRSMGSMVEAP